MADKRLRSYRLSDATLRQLAWLAGHGWNDNATAVVTVAIDRMYTAERSTMSTETRLLALAEAIYSEVFGHLDDKRFRAAKINEIHGWLSDGDGGEGSTVADLADDWRSYDCDVDA